MALQLPFAGSITQYFGVPASSVTSLEPAMWHVGNVKAWWQQWAGASYLAHFHPGVDLAAVEGTPIEACETGVVVFAGWKNNIDGRQVEVKIGSTAIYSFSHMDAISVAAGQHVAKGQKVGTVGMTGSTTGPHTHWGVGLIQAPGNATWPVLFDPLSFIAGGANADSSWIRPPSAPVITPPVALASDTADGDPYPMHFRRISQANAGFESRTIRAGKPVRRGALTSSPTWTTVTKDTAISAFGRIPKADLPVAEQQFGDVLLGVWYQTNGDHIAYFKESDLR